MESETTGRPLTLTAKECAKALRMSLGGVYEGVRDKSIPSVRIGRRVLIPRVALERMLDPKAPA